MRNQVKKQKIALLLLAVGILSVGFGIHRQEHVTVAQKSNIICMECIGIG